MLALGSCLLKEDGHYSPERFLHLHPYRLHQLTHLAIEIGKQNTYVYIAIVKELEQTISFFCRGKGFVFENSITYCQFL